MKLRVLHTMLHSERDHLHTLQWAREHGCPWNELACTYAAQEGHLHILQWCVANGCPFDRESCIASAIERGHTTIEEWIRSLP